MYRGRDLKHVAAVSVVTAPAEPKPIDLDFDFDSPVFVEIFCKLARADAAVFVTEMLPTFDQLWLLDAEGAAYCGELRFVMVNFDVATGPA